MSDIDDKAEAEERDYRRDLAEERNTEIAVQYVGTIGLLIRIRNQLDRDSQELVDAAVEDAKRVGFLENAYQMKSGDWFL